MVRLDKILSEAGVASRRELRELIRAGRVTVDGAVARAPEQKTDPASDIRVDGKPIAPAGPVTILLYKPAGCVTSTDDPRDQTVLELLPAQYRSLFPIGRLDKATEGLLLLTSDGPLAHRLISPKYRVDKEYYCEHEGQAGTEDVAAFAAGLTLRDGTVCLPAVLAPEGPGRSRVTICEGKYHQVRRMMAARGMTVTYLRREREGELTLDGLKPGEFRELSVTEIRKFDEIVIDGHIRQTKK